MNLIDNFFEKINNLPMLPKVVQEVNALLSAEDVDVKAIANVIDNDQVLSAKVLRMSNSAYFGCSRTIKTIEDAVAIIGLRNLRSLVVASGITSTFTEVPGLNLKSFWQHSLVTASVARQLGKELKLDSETAYIGGLMHSIGQLPIHLVFPSAGAQIAEISHGRSALERQTIEHSMIGIDHCQIGELLAKLWNFPEEILCVIRHYADPLNEGACPLAPIVNIAVHIGFDLESGKESQSIAETLDSDIKKALELNDAEEWIERIESYRVFVHEAKNYI